MPIVSQSATASYSLFLPQRLLLPAPKIAELLPARVGGTTHGSSPTPLTYTDPRLVDLSDMTGTELDKLVAILHRATVGLLADDLSESEFAVASETFQRRVKALYHSAIIGDLKPTNSPFAHTRQRMDEKIEGLLAQSKVHLAETRERIAYELAALHAEEEA